MWLSASYPNTTSFSRRQKWYEKSDIATSVSEGGFYEWASSVAAQGPRAPRDLTESWRPASDWNKIVYNTYIIVFIVFI